MNKDNPTANMNMIKLKIEHPEHDMIVLTNERGDTFTSLSEELGDFLFGLEQYVSTQPKRVSDVQIQQKAYAIAVETVTGEYYLNATLLETKLIEIAKWLRDLPSSQEWISVEDRLPEEAIRVLIHPYQWEFVGFYSTTEKKWYANRVSEIKGVTHWQPLPPKP